MTDDDADLAALAGLMGEGNDIFGASTQQEEDRRAEARIAKRRKRLQQRAAELGVVHPPSAAVTEGSSKNRTIGEVETINSKEVSLTNTRKRTMEAVVSVPIKNEEATMKVEEESKGKDEDEDMFDMFSSSVSPIDTKKKDTDDGMTSATKNRGHGQEDWDDAEGYYKPVIGEMIHLLDDKIQLKVLGTVGKGVFSTVLHCSTVSNTHGTIQLPPTVALKCIRHNERMAHAAQTIEVKTLQKLTGAPGIAQLLLPTAEQSQKNLIPKHRGHVLLAFDYMEYNLRDVLQKFGKGVGLSLQAVRSYFAQLLAACTHLQKQGIIHADLKPDNILVSSDFGVVQIADFGSAIHVDSPEADPNVITPYLVSRFYRAPEIILGIQPTYAADLWSIAVTVAEIFLGNVLFPGTSNNDMLFVMMKQLGAVSNRLVRQHLVQCGKHQNDVVSHFQADGASFSFALNTTDPISNTPIHQLIPLQTHSDEQRNTLPRDATRLRQTIQKARSASDSRRSARQFTELLQKCLIMDPDKRINCKHALRHEFFVAPAAATKGALENR